MSGRGAVRLMGNRVMASKTMALQGNNAWRKRGSIAVVGLALLASACAKDADTNAYLDPTEPADKVYNEALANIDAGNYTEARKKFLGP